MIRLEMTVRKMLYVTTALFLVMAALPVSLWGAHLTGKVLQVHSGDTIEVLADGTLMRIHLYGIHCPELEQAFGREAEKYTTFLTHGKIVTVQVMNRDRRGGIIGNVMLPGEKNLNYELLKAGLAWWNRQNTPDDRILKILENSAWESRIGLWSEPDPVPPWEFGKDITSLPSGTAGSSTSPRSFSEETTVYVTSTGEKYHCSGCRYLIRSMIPVSLGQARTSGLLPCPVCEPPE